MMRPMPVPSWQLPIAAEASGKCGDSWPPGKDHPKRDLAIDTVTEKRGIFRIQFDLTLLCESAYLAKWDRSNCARRRQRLWRACLFARRSFSEGRRPPGTAAPFAQSL
jgi:hypothetical protein